MGTQRETTDGRVAFRSQSRAGSSHFGALGEIAHRCRGPRVTGAGGAPPADGALGGRLYRLCQKPALGPTMCVPLRSAAMNT